jgi:hypothetical protein
MTTDRNDFADHTFSTLPPGYRGWALPCKDDPAAVWVWLSPEEMTGLTPEEAAHKAEFTLGDDRIFMAQHRACKDAWKHYEAAKPRAPAGSIATRLRAAADDLTFSGRPDPHDDKALLREAAAVLDSPDLRLLKDANAEWQEFGQWLVTTFQPGAVEPAAVLCPGGEYESGAAFCRRVLQMALERGAFHWASPTPLWHERQDGKAPRQVGRPRREPGRLRGRCAGAGDPRGWGRSTRRRSSGPCAPCSRYSAMPASRRACWRVVATSSLTIRLGTSSTASARRCSPSSARRPTSAACTTTRGSRTTGTKTS